MTVPRKAFAVCIALLMAACAASPDRLLLARYGKNAGVSGFIVCKNYGCKERVRVSFDNDEWARVREIFAASTTNAAEERERLRTAIALMETIVGPKAGTSGDKAGAAILTLETAGQLDCIDEAYNTTTYLHLMVSAGLLKWHDVGEPQQRGDYITGWPHNTATIIERGSNTAYTVDSWFHANGEAPEIMLLSEWLSGWSPAKA